MLYHTTNMGKANVHRAKLVIFATVVGILSLAFGVFPLWYSHTELSAIHVIPSLSQYRSYLGIAFALRKTANVHRFAKYVSYATVSGILSLASGSLTFVVAMHKCFNDLYEAVFLFQNGGGGRT